MLEMSNLNSFLQWKCFRKNARVVNIQDIYQVNANTLNINPCLSSTFKKYILKFPEHIFTYTDKENILNDVENFQIGIILLELNEF